ncbi:MAG: protein kinase family protein [Rhodothalassiaceae bacterium]
MAVSVAREEEGGARTASPDKGMLLDDRYFVDLARPLPHLDSPGAVAYAVTDTREGAGHYYALVQSPAVPRRHEIIASLLQSPATNLLNPVLQKVARPSGGALRRLVTMIEMPSGPSLATVVRNTPISAQLVRRNLLPGIVKALTALHSRDMTHRAIRPENIFFTSNSLEDAVLGECYCAPPASGQADCYEPLERSTAHPHARGAAGPEADLYALGATILSAFLRRNPSEGRDAERMFASRIGQGSFWALSGGNEIPGVVGTLLRGLLNDDPEERWTLKEVALWLEAAVPARRSVNQIWTFSRPVTFLRQSYSDRRVLARAFAIHPLEAAPFLRNIDFPLWIQNMVTTELFSEKLEKAINVRNDADLSSSRHGDHALVARVISHLDPLGPVRYRGLALCLDGIGPALACAIGENDERRIEAFGSLFDAGVIPAILEIISERNGEAALEGPKLLKAVHQMRSGGASGGLLRVLYDLNPSLPCLSPQLKGGFVASPRVLLKTIDMMVGSGSEISRVLDPHMLAYFASHVPNAARVIDALGAAGNDPARVMGAVAELIAFLQEKLALERLENLSRALARGMKPIITSIKGRRRREAMLEKLDELANGGDICRIARLIDLGRTKMSDDQEFLKAKGRLADLETYIKALRRPVDPRMAQSQLLGARAAAIIGWIAMLVTAFVLMVGGR